MTGSCSYNLPVAFEPSWHCLPLEEWVGGKVAGHIPLIHWVYAKPNNNHHKDNENSYHNTEPKAAVNL